MFDEPHRRKHRVAGRAQRAPTKPRVGKAPAPEKPKVQVATNPSSSDGKSSDDQGDRTGIEVAAYRGLGSWVDVFNHGPWKRPAGTIARMHRRGVRTVYLQTSSYGSIRRVVHLQRVRGFIREAHERDMKIVGWSVPSFKHQKEDLARALAGIAVTTGRGDTFDSFAIDIEATLVDKIGVRNKRLLKLTDRVRKQVGDDYPLGAITPDPGNALYWPRFPFKQVAKRYDVIVPMGYFTFRTSGYNGVRRYTSAGIDLIRRATSNKTPIHFIGGIADDVGKPAARGFVRALRDHRVLGGSLYDFPITSERTWRALRGVPRGRP